MKTEMRPAYYALGSGAWREYVTLLHIPFTIWHLSYVVLGAAVAPELQLDRLAWTCLAFFLGWAWRPMPWTSSTAGRCGRTSRTGCSSA